MVETGCALAMRVGAQRHTKAQVQPAKEGDLDSECEGAAGRKLQRRRVYVPVRGAVSGDEFQTNLMWNQGQILCLLRGVCRDRRHSRVFPLDLTA